MDHRMDECPDPSNKLCRGCGISNPTEDHGCIPKCGLCGVFTLLCLRSRKAGMQRFGEKPEVDAVPGRLHPLERVVRCIPFCSRGNHLTADRACKARFKIPYIVRRRRWERHPAKEKDDAERGNREGRGPAGGPRRSASKQRDRSQTPDRSSNSGGGNGRQSHSRSKPRFGSGKGDGNRRWETTNRTASESRASSRSGASSKSRNESTEHRGIAEKKVGWTNRSPFTQTSETESPPLTPSLPLNSQANPQRDPSEVTELKRIIERHNAQIKEENAQIRALMNKTETLVSNGNSANTKPQNNTMAANDGLNEVPRRDSP
ncbi:hypothetical protein HPB52_021884 [Rhipicephalus sanguineus]|uniref:Uncharacterized protein n=1 Tax=Rhipicephalus sanguineus TaxID=34632 RepID=A0A9D4SQV7_RHISA|nr:hypothetical protein HPB52_021884 [Rhipicephalus sanguineus]